MKFFIHKDLRAHPVQSRSPSLGQMPGARVERGHTRAGRDVFGLYCLVTRLYNGGVCDLLEPGAPCQSERLLAPR